MPGKTPFNFALVVEKAGSRYRAVVLDSPAGQGESTFRFPFSKKDLEIFRLKVGQPRQGVRRANTPEMDLARESGTRLFQAVFSGDVFNLFQRSCAQARQAGKGLRVQLRIKDPRLAGLPWEYLYNPALNRFLSQCSDTPVVRYLDMPEATLPQPAALPLKTLVLIANPKDLPALDVEGEWQRLSQSLAPAVKRGLVQVERMEKPTLEALQDKLRSGGPYHVLHFIGHGTFDEITQDGLLVFENEIGASQAVNGQRLGAILHNHPSLRLAVLNACEGGRGGFEDAFAGVAYSLVQQGLPAVIAMQFAITDQAALIFAREFYAALADGLPLDAALAEARVAIFAGGNDIEWGTPVLFMRCEDGRIFDLEAAFPGDGKPDTGALATDDRNLHRKKTWQWIAANFGIMVMLAAFGWLWPGISQASPTPRSPGTTPTSSPSHQPTLIVHPPSQTTSPTLTSTHAPSATATPTGTRTSTPTLEKTVRFTRTPTTTLTSEATRTQTPTPSMTPALSRTPRPIIPYQIKQRLLQEAALALSSHVERSILDALFWENARVFNPTTGQQWRYQDFYQQAHLTILENRHENLTVEDFSTSRIVLLSDNCRIYRKSSKEETSIGNILGTRWVFENQAGIWKITDLWIENPPPSEIIYNFEDGTTACWRISSVARIPPGASLLNSTDLAHEGSRALAVGLDLTLTPGEERLSIEHDTSLPLIGIRRLSAWLYIHSDSGPTPLEAQFFLRTTAGVWSASQAQVIQPNTWTYLEAVQFSPGLSSAGSQSIRIEILLPDRSGNASFHGIVFVDQIHIESEP